MTGYDSGARLKCTRWALAHRPHVERFDVLTRSKLVAMGVAVANVATSGMIIARTDRKIFEQELRESVTRAQGGPRSG